MNNANLISENFLIMGTKSINKNYFFVWFYLNVNYTPPP